MNERDIRQALKRGQAAVEAGRVPAFDRVWSAADQRLAARRRRRYVAVGFVAALAVIAVASGLLQPRQPDWEYVDPEVFATGTSWHAPSDVLLPEHRIDIYEEIPVLIESTEIDGGTLL